MQITLFVDAPSKFLCDWLADFTWNAPSESFPTEKGRIGIQRARLSSQGNMPSMVMDGAYFVPKDDGSEIAYLIKDVIEFKIIPLTPNRIEIRARCNQRVVTEYFLHLLAEMNKRWPQPQDVLVELAQLRKAFEAGLAELKKGQGAIYAKIGEVERASLAQILSAVQHGRVEQGEIQRTLDAVRRALKQILTEGIAIDDGEVKKALEDIYKSVNSDLDTHQQLELSLPIIPFLLEYKLGIDANVDLEAVWKELIQRVRKSNGNA